MSFWDVVHTTKRRRRVRVHWAIQQNLLGYLAVLWGIAVHIKMKKN